MLKDLFGSKSKYVTVEQKKRPRHQDEETDKKEMPDDLWTKCQECEEIIFNKKLAENLKVCPECGYHFRLTATERISLLVDEGEFEEYDANLEAGNPLNFPDYEKKIDKYQNKTGLKDAVVAGIGEVNGYQVSLAALDARFLMGSMNSVVGEKLTRAIERALDKKLPLIIVAGGGGGARMYEGMLSLMQMAKTSAALKRLDQAGQLYVSILTDPTYGGISASFASLGDINIGETDAKIGFAGPRVIKQTINRDLPEDFQTANFLEEHGMLDKVVNRSELKDVLKTILEIHYPRGEQK
ncbi:acetyl-CoA carboxylase, carboxyl transferase, beta subunit [Halobacteroides halobius DSM 5150]|uniref:Acetyl-coenzyme A carboxylase carboxyl transferase subunit beta n=1 Tax=Halobacteroides halobius (strain ATCC 35273 / DSM 5150 / MD-1) TaxID=748449 RepID=L0K5W3_HALHC|nr:acetyl-CoA carboxylase, carboxyltransferase subunit beta [Halobacteroides halobius]AGB40391.1 acetyl-CoA carboxylase, carboxyl transferase, beta subunit [Halobacteroides halobius DSM 5150]